MTHGIYDVACRRQVLFTLPGLGHQAAKVLKLLQSSLEAHGAHCTADTAAFLLTADLPLPDAPIDGSSTRQTVPGMAAASATQQGMPGPRAEPALAPTGSNDINAADSAAMGLLDPQDSEATRPTADEQSLHGPQPGSFAIGPVGPPPPASLATQTSPGQRHTAEASSGSDSRGSAKKGSSREGGCRLKLTVLQQPGQGRIPELVIKASIAAQTSDAVALHFTTTMDRVDQDLRILLGS